jgi:CheY-like chemotaxis protein
MPSTILIVEDDADIRESVRDLLEEEGYAVVVANNGQQALDLLHKAAPLPSLLLVDLLMPVMDGVEFLQRIQLDQRLVPIPVLVFSASSTVQPPAGTPMLRKPLAMDELLEAIRQHCASARSP